MPKLSTPNEKRKCVKKVTKPKRKYVKKALPIGSTQESSVTEDHKEVAEIPKTENLLVDDEKTAMVSNVNRDLKDDNKMAMVSNVNHELKDDNRLGLDSTMQDGMDNKSEAMGVLNGFDLGFDSNQNELRWNVRALRSVGEYWTKPGYHQYNSLLAYKRIFKVDSCLRFAEIDEVLVTAPRDHIAVLEEQELQITERKSNPEHMVDGTTCRKTSEIHAAVPYQGRGRAKHEVDLDPESLRKWNQLVKIYSGVDEEKEEGEREHWWRRELLTFHGRIDLFISLLH
ncbi:hypothetical protein NC651_008447 [Populus alba x Populus x berolinensis]|nr:hypothetical protein NC651_008447 [Populus alba x Populus x berolinensis]